LNIVDECICKWERTDISVALNSINIRRLFVHAYQAYIFNRCLSHAIVNGENILQGNSGDLCFEMEGPLAFGKIRKFNAIIDVDSRVVPALRLVGYSFQTGKGRFELITKQIMEKKISLQEILHKGNAELSNQVDSDKLYSVVEILHTRVHLESLSSFRKAHMPQRFCVRL
jgi:tRNA(Glu) U13 pseudouridine synthase TruD